MKKRISSIFKFLIITSFFLFVTLYISNRNGYYAYSNYKQNVLTEESIKRFESDVREGKPIDIENYVEKDKDYSNNLSRISLRISNKISGYIRNSIVSFFEKIANNLE